MFGGVAEERDLAEFFLARRVRRKIERDPGNPLIVQTVRGLGYRLVAAP